MRRLPASLNWSPLAHTPSLLHATGRRPLFVANPRPHAIHHLQPTAHCAGTTSVSVTQPRSAALRVPSRETARPVTRDDKCNRPSHTCQPSRIPRSILQRICSGWQVCLPTSRLFYVTDKNTGVQYLVDTGAKVSVIPPSRTTWPRQPDHLTLQAVNNTSIKTYGKRSLTLDLGLRRTFRCEGSVSRVRDFQISA